MQGLLSDTASERVCIAGGMRALCRTFARWLEAAGGELSLSADVYGVRRRAEGVEVRWMDVDGPRQQLFDHVVLALPVPALATVLEDATAVERAAFRAVPVRSDRVVVHMDQALMPRDRSSWTPYNVVVRDGDAPRVASVTFWQNRLADLDPKLPDVFVTLNPVTEPARQALIATRYLVRPIATAGSLWGRGEWASLQGRGGVWYCGSYMEAPFLQEQALRSGQHAAAALIDGIDAPARERVERVAS
jgi:predicted NAD/FAD-binding protein